MQATNELQQLLDDGEHLLSQSATKLRYDIRSDNCMRLVRWRREAGFPAPIVIRGRNYYRLSELRAWENKQQRGVLPPLPE